MDTMDIALIVALVEMAKRLFRAATGEDVGDWAILIAVAVGIGLAIGRSGLSVDTVIQGIVSGLTAAGLYSAGVTIVRGRTRQSEEERG